MNFSQELETSWGICGTNTHLALCGFYDNSMTITLSYYLRFTCIHMYMCFSVRAPATHPSVAVDAFGLAVLGTLLEALREVRGDVVAGLKKEP